MKSVSLSKRLAAEFLGSAFLLAAVVGSGIMAAKLSAGNVGLALLANSLATGAVLYVLITIFAPLSGAHFNPAVTLVARLGNSIDSNDAVFYVLAQIAGAVAGVWLAHAMFDLAIIQTSLTARTGIGQWIGEFVAAAGLILTIAGTAKFAPREVPAAVGLYIVSAYWFTSSTSFANPAVTIARALTDTFAGIAPGDVLAFIASQVSGAVCGHALARWLLDGPDTK